jgi:hypothetical protein
VGQRGYRGQRDESCTEPDRAGKFHHVTQNGEQFETYELFISGIFHLIILGRGKPRIPNPLIRGFYCTDKIYIDTVCIEIALQLYNNVDPMLSCNV